MYCFVTVAGDVSKPQVFGSNPIQRRIHDCTADQKVRFERRFPGQKCTFRISSANPSWLTEWQLEDIEYRKKIQDQSNAAMAGMNSKFLSSNSEIRG